MGQDSNACTILVLAGTGSNWLPGWQTVRWLPSGTGSLLTTRQTLPRQLVADPFRRSRRDCAYLVRQISQLAVTLSTVQLAWRALSAASASLASGM